MEIQAFRHSLNKFSLLCCMLLGSFNGNVLHQRGLDKYFQERFVLVSTFSCWCQNIKKGTLPQIFSKKSNRCVKRGILHLKTTFSLNNRFLCWYSKSPLKVPWRFQTLGPLRDLQGTCPGLDQQKWNKTQLHIIKESVKNKKTKKTKYRNKMQNFYLQNPALCMSTQRAQDLLKQLQKP